MKNNSNRLDSERQKDAHVKTYPAKRYVVEVRQMSDKSTVVQMLKTEGHRSVDTAFKKFVIVNTDKVIDKAKYSEYALVHEQS